jgi:hypothetical protein
MPNLLMDLDKINPKGSGLGELLLYLIIYYYTKIYAKLQIKFQVIFDKKRDLKVTCDPKIPLSIPHATPLISKASGDTNIPR